MPKVSVILPAAGTGKRFGGNESKIFQRLAGKCIFMRALEAFTTRSDVCQVQLVVSPADMEPTGRRFGVALAAMGVSVVQGGATRSQSVRNALAKMSQEAELICVHDAVRPCISPAWVDAVFAEAARSGAAILAYPVHGTLKKVGPDGAVACTLPREQLWEAQTPQVFRRDVLLAAYASGGDATDDAALVEAIGQRVSVVAGDPRNIKITTAADLALAEAIIGTLSGCRTVPSSGPPAKP